MIAPGTSLLPAVTVDRRPALPVLRRLFALALPEWPRLLAGTLFLLAGSGAGLMFPRWIGLVMDRAVGGASPGAIDRAAGGMLLLVALGGVAVATRSFLFGLAGERIVAELRGKLYAAILDQEIAFFDARRTGELTSRLSADTSLVQAAVTGTMATALRCLISGLGGVAFLFYISPLLASLMLGVVPFTAIVTLLYGRKLRRLSRDGQDAFAAACEIADETIAGMRTVRSFAAERRERHRYDRAIARSVSVARRRLLAGGTFTAVAFFASAAAVIAVFWIGGRMVARHQMTAGSLTMFLVYTVTVALSLSGFAELWAEIARAAGAAERVFELLDRPPALPARGGLVPAVARGAVAFAEVSFAYPSRPEVVVLDELELSVAPGEAVALVGPSGAGKSTIAALLARFYDPRHGRVLLDGHDLRTLDPQWLRRQIGIVAQEPVLFSASVLDNLVYGRPDATPAEVEAAARTAHCHEFITTLPSGYQTAVGERGVQLSGGQKQRIAIARAILKDPRVLILDEATSALDAESEHLVQEALERLMRQRTTLIIAHRLSTVMSADRVVVIDAGRLMQSGSHAHLAREQGLYRRLLERQLVGGQVHR
jgi:ABC transporter fused permease/ATP-binding protein